MNKSELIEALAARTSTSKKAAKETVDALIEVISETLAKKEEVDEIVDTAIAMSIALG